MSEYTIEPRPTIYDGVSMRSRLEARFAGWLDLTGHQWDYEASAYAHGNLQWLPDFTFPSLRHSGIHVVVDVKPAESFVTLDLLVRAQITTWSSHPDRWVAIVWPDPYDPDRWLSAVQRPDRPLAMGWLPEDA